MFHGKRHPKEMGVSEVEAFLTHLAVERREIIIREGKGNKDRVTMLPKNLFLHLQNQLAKVKQLHDKDLSEGFRRGLFAQCLGAQVSACR